MHLSELQKLGAFYAFLIGGGALLYWWNPSLDAYDKAVDRILHEQDGNLLMLLLMVVFLVGYCVGRRRN